MAEGWKKRKISNVFSPFILCKNRNRSVPVRESLYKNSLFAANYTQQFTATTDLFLKLFSNATLNTVPITTYEG